MPFDGIEFVQRDHLLNKLDRVVHLLESKKKWRQHQFLDFHGGRCILGALFLTRSRRLLEGVILEAIRDVTGPGFKRIDRFNDDTGTDHALVMAVLDRAHDRILAGQIPPASPRQPLLPRTLNFLLWGAE